MKKKVTIVTIILVIVLAATTVANTSYRYYRNLAKRNKIGIVREYWNEDVTCELLENRGNDIVIEKIIGVCIDNKGNGEILNYTDPNYNYISYRGVRGVRKGDTVLTICIYTPGNSYTDDVCDRFDYIIDRP